MGAEGWKTGGQDENRQGLGSGRFDRPIPRVDIFAYPETEWNDDTSEVRAQYAEAFAGEPADFGWGGGEPQLNSLEEVSARTLLSEEQVNLLVADAVVRAEERGTARGMERGIAQAREEAQRLFEMDRARLQGQVAVLAGEFSVERERYFHQVEHEAVRLALAIAARILRREAQMDPLLLTGAVRVALGQLAEATAVRLRVPVVDEKLWREALALMPALPLRPKIVADARLGLGECRMETELGSADLGLRTQLAEIERGFFDRVGAGQVSARSGTSGAIRMDERAEGGERLVDVVEQDGEGMRDE